MKIRFVVPLSLLMLVSGWFIGTKTWESHASATEIEKSLCNKTFPGGKNCTVIVLKPETSYDFNKIKQLVPAVVDDIVNEETKQDPTSNNVNNNSQEISRRRGEKKNRRPYTKRGRRTKAKRNFTRRRRTSIQGFKTWSRTDRFKDSKAMDDSNL